jgi:hypothetical protein
MNLEGFNSEIIDLEPSTPSKLALKHNKEMLGNIPPPPPPLPGNLSSSPVKINPLDLQNVKLKKTIVKPKEKMKEVKDLRIPTKNQLLEQLKNLKKSKS